MTVHRSLDELRLRLLEVQDVLLELQVTATQDRPAGPGVVVVDRLSDDIDNLIGHVREAFTAVGEAVEAAGPLDLEVMLHRLEICQERCDRVAYRFSADVASTRRIDDLSSVGRDRGHDWRAWSATVKDTIDRCLDPMHHLSGALAQSWQEIAARAADRALAVDRPTGVTRS